jgi:hypothetical protein
MVANRFHEVVEIAMEDGRSAFWHAPLSGLRSRGAKA